MSPAADAAYSFFASDFSSNALIGPFDNAESALGDEALECFCEDEGDERGDRDMGNVVRGDVGEVGVAGGLHFDVVSWKLGAV